MPASKHTRKANTAKKKRQWEHVRESIESRGGSHASAIIQANGVLKNRAKKRHKRQ